MVWLAFDPRTGTETDADDAAAAAPTGALEHRQLAARRRGAPRGSTIRTSRTVVEIGVQDHWPYVAVDRRARRDARRVAGAASAAAADDAAGWVAGVCAASPSRHDAGIAHLDLQLHHVLVNERGQARVMALAVAAADAPTASPIAPRGRDGAAAPLEPAALARATRRRRARRARLRPAAAPPARRRAGARQQPTSAPSIERMAPRGREIVRLPWTTPHPIPEPLRAIANRSTSAQERQRYRNARTFLGALDGWLEATADDDGGPLALLLDRLRTVGHLPALPGLGDARRAHHRRSRASAPTRSRAICCPTWRCRSSCCARSTRRGAGHADRRQRPGADAAPRRRADRRRRRSPGREQPARLAGPARRRRGARAARDDRSRPPRRPRRAGAAPGGLRRRGRCTWSRCCRTSAGCWCSTTSPTRPSRSAS